ncbi:hypothetical protein [Streptomyces tremellae]|uniref:Uncharacterized protein n=1 Tax=Streptomyces tremellae TaxID=1124239 RepID=A0ABP7G3I1_9ACTN
MSDPDEERRKAAEAVERARRQAAQDLAASQQAQVALAQTVAQIPNR